MAKKEIYLDHNATTPLHPKVKQAMFEAFEDFGNPSSLHAFGQRARSQIEQARHDIAEFIDAQPEEIIFTGSGSEANNSVFSMFNCPSSHCHIDRKGHLGVITTAIEHPCVMEAAKCISERGATVKFLPVDKYGKVDLDKLTELITPSTGLVSVMAANNEIGTVQDIKKISQLVHLKGALFHTDSVQAVGKIPLSVKDWGVDFLTFSAHKIYGPKGVGALYIRRGVPFCALIRGGHQERGRRAGTENTVGIVGFAQAIKQRKIEMAQEHQRLSELKQWLRQEIEKRISDVFFNGHPKDCLASTLNVSFAGVEGEAVLLYLDLEGIAVSTGSACASGSLDPSHVLLAIGVGAESAHSSIRVSMGRETNQAELEYFVDKLVGVIEKVRKISTVYKSNSR